MADGKRLSNAGKVATPKVGGQTMSELDTALTKAVGGRVRVTTTLPGKVLEGVLYTACPITNLIAVNTAPPPPNPASSIAHLPGDYNIIPVSAIQNFQILSLPAEADRLDGSSGLEGAIPSIGRLDLENLKQREEAAVKKLKDRQALRSIGVTDEAFNIFDFFESRMMPVEWHETNMVVNGAVLIVAPYGVENCSAPKEKEKFLPYITKVLDAYWRKKPQGNAATLNSGSRPSVATPMGPRKGG